MLAVAASYRVQLLLPRMMFHLSMVGIAGKGRDMVMMESTIYFRRY